MHLKEINDQTIWDGLVSARPWASFPQSWDWGEFQASQGYAVRRFFLVESTHASPSLACQLVWQPRKLFGYWFAPRGPVFAAQASREIFHAFLSDLAEAIQASPVKGRPLFHRFEPIITLAEAKGIMPIRMRRTHAMNPAATITLDLAASEDDLLAAMHQKTRYNIKLAAKHGVTIREGNGTLDLETFIRLTEETAARDQFQSHSADYLRATYQFLATRGMARLRLAEYRGNVLAANMEIAYGDTATYLHGASSSQDRHVMSPFLLQWEAMRAAKAEGKKYYDLWGANPESKSSYYYKPAWEGITRFKEGFGGNRIELVGTWDLPVNRFFYQLAFPESFSR